MSEVKGKFWKVDTYTQANIIKFPECKVFAWAIGWKVWA